MTWIITRVVDCGDGVCIEREQPSTTSLKTMTNTELTLDQLSAIVGGVQMGPDGSTCTDRHIWKSLQDILGRGDGKSIVHPNYRVGEYN